jgi:alpha-mannosidase
VLFGQVHDNIDGSAVAEVYRDAATDYGDIKYAGGKMLNSALSTIAKQVNTQGEGRAVLIFNSLPWERTGMVSLDAVILCRAQHFNIVDAAGHAVPYQLEGEGGTAKALFFAERSAGNGVQGVSRGGQPTSRPKFATDLVVSGLTLANSQIEVVIDPDSGNLKSLKKKGMETNFLREDNPGAALEVWEDKPANAPAASRRGISILVRITSWIKPRVSKWSKPDPSVRSCR